MDTSIPIDKAKTYILSGKAVVIFTNTQTGEAFRYKVSQDKKNENLWWVNTIEKSRINGLPHRIGTINSNGVFTQSKPWVQYETPETKIIEKYQLVFKWMWARIVRGYWKEGTNEEEIYRIMHDGTCGKCGRQLTDIDSIKRGIGPECLKQLGIK